LFSDNQQPTTDNCFWVEAPRFSVVINAFVFAGFSPGAGRDSARKDCHHEAALAAEGPAVRGTTNNAGAPGVNPLPTGYSLLSSRGRPPRRPTEGPAVRGTTNNVGARPLLAIGWEQIFTGVILSGALARELPIAFLAVGRARTRRTCCFATTTNNAGAPGSPFFWANPGITPLTTGYSLLSSRGRAATERSALRSDHQQRGCPTLIARCWR